MADIPTPRSYPQILGDMVDAFLARYPVSNLKVGGPLLSIMEAAAQSDLRNTGDIFKFLASVNLDSSEGDALDKILKDEGTQRLGALPATGNVTIGDSRYVKLSSALYHGFASPIIGTSTVYVSSAVGWPASGQVYLGRGTENYEGPISYTAINDFGSYYSITLSSPTTRFHNVGESVIVAQGGDRAISAGTTVQISQGNAATPVAFSVVYNYTLLDGEISLSGIQVISTQAGIQGNAPVGAINTFASAPFTGATVTNPLPFTNGFDAESDEQARIRVRALRKAKTKGTVPAIEAYLKGIVAEDESKRVVSVKVVEREGLPSIAYIDDGTGYEEIQSGVASEVLTNSATGGEEYFQLALGRPVAKANITSTSGEPWDLTFNTTLSVRVGGLLSNHTFASTDFRAMNSCAAFEVVHSINANSLIDFSARLSGNGRTVTLFAKSDTNEDIEVVAPLVGTDANDILGFPSGRVDTCKLFKNDVLLSKDGRAATIESSVQSLWQPILTTYNLIVNVDGTGDVTYTFVDADFTNAGTAYNAVSAANSLDAWAAVFNYKIPGITATVVGAQLVLTSNAGPVARGSLEIVSGDFVTANVFAASTSTARERDYTLNRNTGQLRLVVPLVAGDTLLAGSSYTNAFLESSAISTITLTGIGGNSDMWFAVDGQTQFIQLPLTINTTFTEASQAVAGGPNHIKLTSNEAVFVDVAIGDWVVLLSSNFSNRGAWRVGHKVSSSEIWLAKGAVSAGGPISLIGTGIAVVRTSAYLQKAAIPDGVYTAQSLATAISPQLEGAYAEVVRTGHFRVVADSRQDGDLMYVGCDYSAESIPLTKGALVISEVSEKGFVESVNAENSCPIFRVLLNSSDTSNTTISTANSNLDASLLDKSDLVTGLYSTIYNATNNGVGNHKNQVSSLSDTSIGGGTDLYTTSETALNSWLLADRAMLSRPFCFGPSDDLSIVVDGDIALKRFEIPLKRKVDTSAGAYGAVGVVIRDADHNDDPIATAFGDAFSFNDYALYMHPRLISSGPPNGSLLWRWNQMGAGGNDVGFTYEYPTAADQSATWSMGTTRGGEYISGAPVDANANNFKVALPSGAAIVPANLDILTNVGFMYKGAQGNISKAYLYSGIRISRVVSVDTLGTATVTVYLTDVAGGAMTTHGLLAGQSIYLAYSGAVPLATAQATIVSVGTPTGMALTYTLAPAPADFDTGVINGGYLYRSDIPVTVSNWLGLSQGDVLHSDDVFGTTRLDNKGIYINGIVAATDNTVLEVWFPTNAVAASTTCNWSADAIRSFLTFYPVGATATTIVAAVDDTWPVTCLIPNGSTGAGTLAEATWVTEEDAAVFNGWFQDGINYVKTTTPAALPGNYSIDLKNTPNIAPYADWVSEEAYLVPMTANNLVAFLNSTAIGGIGQSSTILSSTRGGKVQIASDTQGSLGSVEVLGGLGNEVRASIQGSATTTPDNLAFSVIIPTTEVPGFQAGWFCELENQLKENKTNDLPTLNLTGIAGRVWSFSGGTAGDYLSYASVQYQFERHGNYMAAVWNGQGTNPDLSSLGDVSGGYIVFSGGTVSPSNTGTFSIISYHSATRTVWFENANGVEERATAAVKAMTRASLMPGDIINIGTTGWGAGNKRSFTVEAVSVGGTFNVTTVETPSTPTTGTLAVGEQSKVSMVAGSNLKLVRKLVGILPYSGNVDLSVLVFGDKQTTSGISSVFGTTIKALSKLAFSSAIAVGKDGYAYNTGLIGEANRVLYGLESDPVTYPGVRAAGSTVNISGPVVRRIQVSLALRLRSGANKQATFDAVRSAVATYVNGLGVGESVAISEIIAAATAVGGVESVSVSSPTYSTSSDLISVQPYEKALILQSDLDISLTLIG